MQKLDWGVIDKVVYINLSKRHDRRFRLKKQLEKLSVPTEKILRFDAIEHSKGYIGCAMSHVAVLEMAKNNGWNNVLILEDDIEFLRDEKSLLNFKKVLQSIRVIPWNVILLSANYASVTSFKNIDYVVRVNRAWCACAYIVHQKYYNVLLNNYRESLHQLMQGGAQNIWALDVYWQNLMLKDCWIGMWPNFAFQVADNSDIENRYVDYKQLFFKPLNSVINK